MAFSTFSSMNSLVEQKNVYVIKTGLNVISTNYLRHYYDMEPTSISGTSPNILLKNIATGNNDAQFNGVSQIQTNKHNGLASAQQTEATGNLGTQTTGTWIRMPADASSTVNLAPTTNAVTGQTTGQTLAFWFYTTGVSVNGYGMLFNVYHYTETSSWTYFQVQGTALGVYVNKNNTPTSIGNFDYSRDAWHHACLIKQPNGNVTFYLDNVSKGSTIGATLFTDKTRILMQKDYNQWSSNYHHGYIDDVRIYTRAITTDELTTLFNNTL